MLQPALQPPDGVPVALERLGQLYPFGHTRPRQQRKRGRLRGPVLGVIHMEGRAAQEDGPLAAAYEHLEPSTDRRTELWLQLHQGWLRGVTEGVVHAPYATTNS